MNRHHWKRMIPIVEAFANGEDVEIYNTVFRSWEKMDPIRAAFHASPDNYRIAPKPRMVCINEYPNGEFSTWPDRTAADLNATAERVACHEVQLPPAQP